MCFIEIFNQMIWLEGVGPFDNDETVITSGTILNMVRNIEIFFFMNYVSLLVTFQKQKTKGFEFYHSFMNQRK